MKSQLPSERLLEVLVDAFDLRPPRGGGRRKRARRTVGKEGRRPSESSRMDEIHRLAHSLWQSRVLGVRVPAHEDRTTELVNYLMLLGAALDAMPDASGRELLLVGLRGDLAIRTAAWHLLSGEPVPTELPPWLRGDSDPFFRGLLRRCRVTQRELKDAIRAQRLASPERKSAVSVRSVEHALAGRIISEDVQVALARVIAPRGRFDEVAGRMRFHYSLRRLVDHGARTMGTEAVSLHAEWVRERAASMCRAVEKKWPTVPSDLAIDLLAKGGAAVGAVAPPVSRPRATLRSALRRARHEGLNAGTARLLHDEATMALLFAVLPDDAPVWWRGWAALFQGDYDRALDAGQRTILEQPNLAHGYVLAASALVHLQRPGAAKTALLMAPEEVLATAKAGMMLARIEMMLDNARAALRVLRGLRPEPQEKGHIEELMSLAHMILGEEQKAQSHALQAAELGLPFLRDNLERITRRRRCRAVTVAGRGGRGGGRPEAARPAGASRRDGR